MLNLEKSAAAFAEAKTLMPGGVNSPVRSYRSVDCNPPFIAKAEGSHIFDIDGNEYIDYVGSWIPMVVGHAHPQGLAGGCNPWHQLRRAYPYRKRAGQEGHGGISFHGGCQNGKFRY